MSSSPSSEAASSASISSGEQILADDIPSRGASPSEPSSRPASASVPAPASIPSQATNPSAKSRGLAPGASQGPPLPTGVPNHASMKPNPKKIEDNTHHSTHGLLGDVSTDGRIRNPVPSKLLDSASEKDGNFAVMHMDVGKPVMDARSMAAKRTSEMTQAAALQATKNGYKAVKRTKLAWNSSIPQQRQYTPQTVQNPASYGSAPPPPAMPVPPPQALPPLAVKSEQARLLTFLRSIHPVIVVDQLCKAMAYFGGIPGAPPPPNNIYPESENMNGSGALFIGWLSEIFPPADFTKPPFSTMPLPDPPGQISQANPVTKPVDTTNGGEPSTEPRAQEETRPQSEPPATSKTTAPEQDPKTPKRPRGRPKGSKGTKSRKDKGMKKVNRMPDGTLAIAHMSASSLNESIDSHGDSSHDPTSSQVPSDPNRDLHTMSSQLTTTPAQGLGDTSMNETPASGTPSGKRRGRPKGSKNKPKPIISTAHDSSVISPAGKQALSMDRVVAVGWMPAEESASHPRPSQLSSQVENTSRVLNSDEGLSQHAENWAQPPVAVQEPSQPSGLSSQRGDDQSGKRKATGQVGEDDHPPIWTNSQGELGGAQQPQYGLESQAAQNKRPRLSQDGSQSAIISPTETARGPTPTAPMSQDVATSSSSQTLGNYDLSPKVGRMPIQSAQSQYQQPQASQQQINEQRSSDMSFYRAAKAPSHPFSSQQPSQDIHERPNQARQAFYTQQQNQQRTQQYRQQFQNQTQFAQLKAASNMIEPFQASKPSPGSSPTEPRRQNPSGPAAARMAAAASTYPAAYANDSSFLTMEYAMSANRAVEQSQNTFASQPTQTQLEAALTEHERLFQAFNGRR